MSLNKIHGADERPLITVIIAVLNGSATLERCLKSIAGQTHERKETIVIDGGSTDGTIDILKRHHPVIVTCWRSGRDRGIFDAWNKGLSMSRGEWICFMGVDDHFWTSDALDRMAKHLQNMQGSTRIVYGKVALVSKGGDLLEIRGDPWEIAKKKFKQVMVLPHQAVMHRRSVFEENGAFSDKFRIAGDYEFLLRELRNRDAVFVPEVITAMQVGGISSRPENSATLLAEMRLAQKMNGVSLLPGWRWLAACGRLKIRQLLRPMIGDRLTRQLLDLGRVIMGKEKFWTRTN